MATNQPKWRIYDTTNGAVLWEGSTEGDALDNYYLLRMNGFDKEQLQIMQPWS